MIPYTVRNPISDANYSPVLGIAARKMPLDIRANPVGSTRQTFGENLHKTLPHSGPGFKVSCKQWFAPIPQFGDESRGTLPDILVDENVFVKYRDSNDPVLSYALDYISSQ